MFLLPADAAAAFSCCCCCLFLLQYMYTRTHAVAMVICDFVTRIAPQTLGDLKPTGPIKITQAPTAAAAQP